MWSFSFGKLKGFFSFDEVCNVKKETMVYGLSCICKARG